MADNPGLGCVFGLLVLALLVLSLESCVESHHRRQNAEQELLKGVSE